MKGLATAVGAALCFTAGVLAQGMSGQAGQTAPSGPATPLIRTASIAGQVVDGDTGQPVAGAVVRLQMRTLAVQASAAARAGGRGAQALSAAEMAANSGLDFVMSEADGRFVFHDLPKGPALLAATAGGYVEPPGTTIRPHQLIDGQHLSDIKVRLVRTASVSGVIVDEAGEPLVGVSLRAMRREMPSGTPRYKLVGSARTDDRGLYRLDGLVPGQFFVVLPQTQTTVPVANLEKSADSIGGILGAAANSPFVEALTGGMQSMIGNAGVRVGDQIWQMGGGGAAGAPPPPVNGRVAAYQTSFYPGATQLSQATPITLKSGEARTGVDWQVRPTGVARVSGFVTGPEGPAGSVIVRLIPAPGAPDDDALPVATATSAADGSFVFFGVPTGQYVAKAQQLGRGAMPPGISAEMLASLPPETMAMIAGRMGGGGDSSFLRAAVGVGDKDVIGLALSLRPGARVSGRVVFDGTAPVPTPQQLQSAQVSLAASGGQNAPFNQSTKLAANLTFKTGAYAAGNYTVNISGVPGTWMVKSVMIGGREAVSAGLELGDTDIADAVITFTDRIPSIAGSVKSDGTAPLPNASVILIPADYRAWLASPAAGHGQVISLVQPGGAYAIGRLLPGDYLLAALPDEVLAGDHDTAFYEALARVATRVTVGDGEKMTLELRLVRSLR